MGMWGFPQSSLELRHLIKASLDGQGKQISRFHNNLPGKV